MILCISKNPFAIHSFLKFYAWTPEEFNTNSHGCKPMDVMSPMNREPWKGSTTGDSHSSKSNTCRFLFQFQFNPIRGCEHLTILLTPHFIRCYSHSIPPELLDRYSDQLVNNLSSYSNLNAAGCYQTLHTPDFWIYFQSIFITTISILQKNSEGV